MRKYKFISKISLLFVLCLSVMACEEITYEHTPVVSFTFNGVDEGADNIVIIADGVTEFQVEGTVTSSKGIAKFAIHTSNPRTGKESGTPIEGTEVSYTVADAPNAYSFSHLIEGIESDAAIKVIIEDTEGTTYKAALVIDITPQVLFSQKLNIESYDYFYGSYFATWFEGRVYMERTLLDYGHAVEITMGLVDDVPKFVSPAAREGLGLTNFEGANETKFALTELTKADFEAIKEVDKSPLLAFSPTENAVEVVAGNVYAFQTHKGLNGLIYVDNLATTQHRDLENVTVHTATIFTKIETE